MFLFTKMGGDPLVIPFANIAGVFPSGPDNAPAEIFFVNDIDGNWSSKVDETVAEIQAKLAVYNMPVDWGGPLNCGEPMATGLEVRGG
jgi:hypothetical protein